MRCITEFVSFWCSLRHWQVLGLLAVFVFGSNLYRRHRYRSTSTMDSLMMFHALQRRFARPSPRTVEVQPDTGLGHIFDPLCFFPSHHRPAMFDPMASCTAGLTKQSTTSCRFHLEILGRTVFVLHRLLRNSLPGPSSWRGWTDRIGRIRSAFCSLKGQNFFESMPGRQIKDKAALRSETCLQMSSGWVGCALKISVG